MYFFNPYYDLYIGRVKYLSTYLVKLINNKLIENKEVNILVTELIEEEKKDLKKFLKNPQKKSLYIINKNGMIIPVEVVLCMGPIINDHEKIYIDMFNAKENIEFFLKEIFN